MIEGSFRPALWPRAVLLALAVAAIGATVPADAKPAHRVHAARSMQSEDSAQVMADHIVVHKAQRRMDLMRGATVLRSYHIALGLYPVGPKERAGDSRTPEGHYYLGRRNPRSDYFLSIQISYPNEADAARARARGWDPGGSIMIHGRPNELRREPAYYETHDWTDGCISVSDSDMLEVWLMTPPQGIPIDILP